MRIKMLNNPVTEETAGKTRGTKLRKKKDNNRRKRGNNKQNQEKQGKQDLSKEV